MHRKILYALSVVVLSSAALATPSHAGLLDLGMKGGNFSAWTTLGECEVNRPRENCGLLYTSDYCGEIYVPKNTYDEMLRAARAGKSISVNTMKNGYFEKLLCELVPK